MLKIKITMKKNLIIYIEKHEHRNINWEKSTRILASNLKKLDNNEKKSRLFEKIAPLGAKGHFD